MSMLFTKKSRIFALLLSVMLPLFLVFTVVGATTLGADLTVTSGARVGEGSTPDAFTALADDSLFVEGALEVDGAVRFDGNATLGNAVTDNLTFTGAVAGANAFIFDGLTDDAFEITLAITDPGADFTVTIPAATGALVLSTGGVAEAANAIWGASNAFVFEGATANTEELTLTVADPAGDVTVTIPAITGTLITTGDTGTVTSTIILDNTLTATDLNATLTFADADLINLAAILHDDAAAQGLRLPNVAGAPTAITANPEGHIAWDATNNLLYVSTDAGWASTFTNTASNNTYTGSNIFGDAVTDGLTFTAAVLGANAFILDGATDDAFETTIAVTDPGADFTITIPAITGTLVTTGETGSVTSTMLLDATILTGDIAADTILAGNIATGAVTTAEILDATIVAADIANTVCLQTVAVEINPTEAGATNDFINLVDNSFSATETDEDMFMVPVAAVAHNLSASIDVAPGVGNDDWKIFVRDDAASTILTCSIDEAATTCSDAVNAPAIGAASKLDILVDSSGAGPDPAAAAALTISFCLGQ